MIPPKCDVTKSIMIKLEEKDIHQAYTNVGILAIDSYNKGYRPAFHLEGLGNDESVVGQLGELAVAKWLGIKHVLAPSSIKSIPDVGKVDVRTAYRQDMLVIRKNDVNNRYMVACKMINLMNILIVGWESVGRVKKLYTLTDKGNGRKPAWFAPHNELFCPHFLKNNYGQIK